ncbi:MAG: hypothetical protein ACXITV_07615 [Luteibaculaceae bacterium]
MEYLIHASLHTDLKELKPVNTRFLFTTENLCFAVLAALRKQFPRNAIRLQFYNLFGFEFAFASLAQEYWEQLNNTPIKLYLVEAKHFSKLVKIESNLATYSFNLVKTPGYEYITPQAIVPVEEKLVYLHDLFCLGRHGMADSKRIIVFKSLVNLLGGSSCFTYKSAQTCFGDLWVNSGVSRIKDGELQ